MKIKIEISPICEQFLELVARDLETTKEEAAVRVLETTAEGNLAIRVAAEYIERGIKVISSGGCGDPNCPSCGRKGNNDRRN